MNGVPLATSPKGTNALGNRERGRARRRIRHVVRCNVCLTTALWFTKAAASADRETQSLGTNQSLVVPDGCSALIIILSTSLFSTLHLKSLTVMMCYISRRTVGADGNGSIEVPSEQSPRWSHAVLDFVVSLTIGVRSSNCWSLFSPVKGSSWWSCHPRQMILIHQRKRAFGSNYTSRLVYNTRLIPRSMYRPVGQNSRAELMISRKSRRESSSSLQACGRKSLLHVCLDVISQGKYLNTWRLLLLRLLLPLSSRSSWNSNSLCLDRQIWIEH